MSQTEEGSTLNTPTGGRHGWALICPPLAAIVLAFTWGSHPSLLGNLIVGVALVVAVLAGVHHAEVVAHRVGEPLGSLILAVAVTIIEVGLIVMFMVGGGEETSTLARDTIFAAVMITLNGIVGLSLVVGAHNHHLAVFNAEGAGSALATVITLTGLTLVVPSFTTGESEPIFTSSQLAFAAVASLSLYAMFVFTQTVRHRDFFLPVATGSAASGTDPADLDADGHADPPTITEAWRAFGLLVVSLICVVGLAKAASYGIRDAVEKAGAPQATVGVIIALLVLLPETIAAARAAARDRTQISLNLAYGSAMASVGLTIPTIAVASIWLEGPLALGLDSVQIVLLALTIAVGVLTVVPGRAKPLNGGVHLVLLAAFLFLTVSP